MLKKTICKYLKIQFVHINIACIYYMIFKMNYQRLISYWVFSEIERLNLKMKQSFEFIAETFVLFFFRLLHMIWIVFSYF